MGNCCDVEEEVHFQELPRSADLTWTHSSTHSGVPADAVFAGNDSDGAPIYVGRASHDGDLLPAKVIPSKNIAYVSHNCQEIPKYSYELLIGRNFTWVQSGGGSVPPQAVMSGHTVNGEPLYIGRGHCEGSLTPGKIHQSHGCLYIPYGGTERRLDTYEVLCAPEMWVSNAGRSDIPPNAVFAGQDSDGEAIYVGRAYHNTDLLPAKVLPSRHVAYVSWNGEEIPKHQYDILCGIGFTWVQSASGHVPPNAVTAGATGNGEPLYIGRGHHAGSLTPGKVHPSHHCLYIPYGGTEVSLPSYEVLVRQL